ncbi:MAG: hypothetical protein KC503_45735 [Myxococcales bacterium]|nr:hypothetical protein [Myxococcales bacterium]
MRDRFDWPYLIVALVLLVGLTIGARVLVADSLADMVAQDRPLGALAISGGIPALTFFLVGLFVGRLTRGREVKVMALASLLGSAIVSTVGVRYFNLNIFAVAFGAPTLFVCGYVGGWIGERWQRIARQIRGILRLDKQAREGSSDDDPEARGPRPEA